MFYIQGGKLLDLTGTLLPHPNLESNLLKKAQRNLNANILNPPPHTLIFQTSFYKFAPSKPHKCPQAAFSYVAGKDKSK